MINKSSWLRVFAMGLGQVHWNMQDNKLDFDWAEWDQLKGLIGIKNWCSSCISLERRPLSMRKVSKGKTRSDAGLNKVRSTRTFYFLQSVLDLLNYLLISNPLWRETFHFHQIGHPHLWQLRKQMTWLLLITIMTHLIQSCGQVLSHSWSVESCCGCLNQDAIIRNYKTFNSCKFPQLTDSCHLVWY